MVILTMFTWLLVSGSFISISEQLSCNVGTTGNITQKDDCIGVCAIGTASLAPENIFGITVNSYICYILATCPSTPTTIVNGVLVSLYCCSTDFCNKLPPNTISCNQGVTNSIKQVEGCNSCATAKNVGSAETTFLCASTCTPGSYTIGSSTVYTKCCNTTNCNTSKANGVKRFSSKFVGIILGFVIVMI